MDNEIHALEIWVGIVIFCMGISLLVGINCIYDKEFYDVSHILFMDHMIRT